MKALIIIDMQVGSFRAETPRFNASQIIRKINLLAELFRKKGNQVVFIQHDGSKENCYLPNSLDWQILPSLNIDQRDLVVSKTANDSFYKSQLENVLKEFEITQLYITGCATDFCVDTTIRSAYSKDYEVTVIKDCHTTADRPALNAEKVIQHHNWIWENMTPAKSKLRVIPFEEVVSELDSNT